MTDHGDATRQFVGLDLLRLIAALVVAIYHFGFWRQTAGDDSLTNMVDPAFGATTKSLTHFGWVGVEIFFVISGFVITLSAMNATPLAFFRSRALRIAPMVWVCAPISFLIFCFTQDKSALDLLAQLVRTLIFFPLFAQIDGVYWTLAIEISFYALVFALLKLSRLEQLERVAIIIGLVSLAFWAAALSVLALVGDDMGRIGFLASKAIRFRIFQLLLIQHGCFFALGVLAFSIHRGGLTRRRTLAMAALLAACWLEIIGQNGIIESGAHVPLSPAPALIFWSLAVATLLLSLVANRRLHHMFNRRLAAIRGIGLLTYPFYLLHNSIGFVIILVLLEQGVSGPLAFGFGIAGALLASWAVMTRLEPPVRALFRSAMFRHGGGKTELAATRIDKSPPLGP